MILFCAQNRIILSQEINMLPVPTLWFDQIICNSEVYIWTAIFPGIFSQNYMHMYATAHAYTATKSATCTAFQYSLCISLCKMGGQVLHVVHFLWSSCMSTPSFLMHLYTPTLQVLDMSPVGVQVVHNFLHKPAGRLVCSFYVGHYGFSYCWAGLPSFSQLYSIRSSQTQQVLIGICIVFTRSMWKHWRCPYPHGHLQRFHMLCVSNANSP